MGLHRFKPMPSGRMGIFWTLSGIKDAAVVEFGCMGHNLYSGSCLKQAGMYEEKGALLYTTYIDETDIAMGDTGRLEATLRYVIDHDRPEVIFLQPSAVPEVVGTDLKAVANVLQEDFEVPLIPIGHGSFAISQHKGVQDALTDLVRAVPVDTGQMRPETYNIIGSCPDLFRYGADALEVKRLMKGAFDMEPVCVLSSDCCVAELRQMGEAGVNLVLRREGIPAAKLLEKRFGTPWVYGRPYGIQGTTRWLGAVGEACKKEPSGAFISFEETLALDQIDRAEQSLFNHHWAYPDESVLSLGGHADVVEGILRFATEELSLKKGVCWCNCPEHGSEEIPYFTENEWMPVVKNHVKGYLMCSGEALLWGKKNLQLQIDNPDIGWRIHPYEAPFVGYHGAVHLVNLWINEYVLTH